MSKRSRADPGQALRGSSDLHAWGDDNAYLFRHHDHLRLVCEHRSAPAAAPIDLRLATNEDGVGAHLEIVGDDSAPPPAAPALAQQIIAVLGAAATPLHRAALRQRLRVNNLRLGDALLDLEGTGRIHHAAAGWSLVATA